MSKVGEDWAERRESHPPGPEQGDEIHSGDPASPSGSRSSTEAACASSPSASIPIALLQRFCGTEEGRPYLHKPWSAGDFTYATDGCVVIRVPRLADVPQMADPPRGMPPNVDAVIPKPDEPSWRRPVARDLPAEDSRKCEDCGGRGTVHACPDCDCDCESCDGDGEISADWRTSLSIGGAPFGLRYVRLILSLPNLEIAASTILPHHPLLFRFAGGDGALMGMTRPHDDHLDIDLLADAPAPGDALEAKARELYEASRKRVAGRPSWERLNPSDPYDMGMRGRAMDEARAALAASRGEGR